jgi:hypothetical protein
MRVCTDAEFFAGLTPIQDSGTRSRPTGTNRVAFSAVILLAMIPSVTIAIPWSIMSELGQNRKCLGRRGMSVLPPTADIGTPTAQVRFVPSPEVS